jgi:hypothetical protein
MYIDACGHVDASQQANKQAWYNRKYFELGGYFPKKNRGSIWVASNSRF